MGRWDTVYISYLLYSMRRIINFTPVKISPGWQWMWWSREKNPQKHAAGLPKHRKTYEWCWHSSWDGGSRKNSPQHTNVCHLEWPLVTVSCSFCCWAIELLQHWQKSRQKQVHFRKQFIYTRICGLFRNAIWLQFNRRAAAEEDALEQITSHLH